MSVKLAWRNIWRNKRRTLITTLSIVVAVFLSVITRSTQEGQYDNMIENTIGTFSGYIQVHQLGYWDDPKLDNSFRYSDSLASALAAPDAVTAVVPRIESYALAATRNQSRPAMVMGIDIEAERQLSSPEDHLQQGSYFDSNSEQSVLVGKDLAARLDASIGDSLVMIGQGYHGMNATGLYAIKGVVSYPSPELNSSLVLLPLETAQEFFSAYGLVTTAALVLENPRLLDAALASLRGSLPDGRYEVMGWRELMPEIEQAIQADRGSGVIILMILYMVVGFGILGTVLMMIAERKYEFGIMLSVGTPRLTLARIVSMEVVIMGLLGAGLGIAAGIPMVWYFSNNPIELTGTMATAAEQYSMTPAIQFSTDPGIFTTQALVVLAITLVFSIVPILKAAKLNPVEAMRS